MQNLAIFASGAGSNADNILHYFEKSSTIRVNLVVCNVPNAGVIEIAKKNGVPCIVIDKITFVSPEQMLSILKQYQIDRIVLAGFLWLIPSYLITSFRNNIVNIHPSLLPKYGGKGMYGMNVHKAVAENKEEITGITIHLVDEIYDNGRILFQKTIDVDAKDTPEEIAHKVHQLEYAYFPKVIEEWCQYGLV
jgi:phosphoribosylglycinamide formyltransferase-1